MNFTSFPTHVTLCFRTQVKNLTLHVNCHASLVSSNLLWFSVFQVTSTVLQKYWSVLENVPWIWVTMIMIALMWCLFATERVLPGLPSQCYNMLVCLLTGDVSLDHLTKVVSRIFVGEVTVFPLITQYFGEKHGFYCNKV